MAVSPLARLTESTSGCRMGLNNAIYSSVRNPLRSRTKKKVLQDAKCSRSEQTLGDFQDGKSEMIDPTRG